MEDRAETENVMKVCCIPCWRLSWTKVQNEGRSQSDFKCERIILLYAQHCKVKPRSVDKSQLQKARP